MKFLGPTGQSNIRDHAKALNFDLCQARRGDHQVCVVDPWEEGVTTVDLCV